MNWLSKIEKSHFIFLFLLIFFGIEALNKVQDYYFGLHFEIQKYLKGLCLAGILIYFLFKDRIKLFALTVFLILFCLGQYFLTESFTSPAIIGFLKYFFFLSLILFFTEINSAKGEIKAFTLFEIILWVNNSIILISSLFGLEIFESYPGDRWGYNGLFMASSNSTYFYIIAILYFVIYNSKTYYKNALFWFTLLASLLIGTKSIYLAIILIGLVLTIRLVKKLKLKVIIASFFLLFSAALGYIFFSTDLFSEIIKQEGWLTAILSYRDQLFIKDTIPYIQEHWETIHYFIGGLSNPYVRPQLELIDLWLYFGFLGMILYLFVFAKSYFNFSLAFYSKCLLAILFIVPFITGNFFYNASVPIYLVVLKLAIIKSQEKLSNGVEYS